MIFFCDAPGKAKRKTTGARFGGPGLPGGTSFLLPQALLTLMPGDPQDITHLVTPSLAPSGFYLRETPISSCKLYKGRVHGVYSPLKMVKVGPPTKLKALGVNCSLYLAPRKSSSPLEKTSEHRCPLLLLPDLWFSHLTLHVTSSLSLSGRSFLRAGHLSAVPAAESPQENLSSFHLRSCRESLISPNHAASRAILNGTCSLSLQTSRTQAEPVPKSHDSQLFSLRP